MKDSEYIEALESETCRYQAVVDAARAWVDGPGHEPWTAGSRTQALIDAVRALDGAE